MKNKYLIYNIFFGCGIGNEFIKLKSQC